jgi:tetratricopeptide (TPR) repeat protein
VFTAASPEDALKEKLDRQYQSAIADYNAGRYAQAAEQLEKLLPYAPKSFEIHEILGLSYAGLSQDEKAVDHLKTAVQIKPDSAEARTNLAPASCTPARQNWLASNSGMHCPSNPIVTTQTTTWASSTSSPEG